jgi:hypothetical protein
MTSFPWHSHSGLSSYHGCHIGLQLALRGGHRLPFLR